MKDKSVLDRLEYLDDLALALRKLQTYYENNNFSDESLAGAFRKIRIHIQTETSALKTKRDSD